MSDLANWSHCFSRLESIIKRPLSNSEQDNLQAYVTMLIKWNKTYNLIGPSTVDNILERHIVDSTPLLPLIDQLSTTLPSSTPLPHSLLRIADIGSGAGLPGLVLRILSNPSTRISLIESAGKKARFLDFIIKKLALGDRCAVFNERAEKHSLKNNNEYHYVVSRAVGTLSLLAELSYDLLQPGGYCLALKGARSEDEIEEFMSSKLRNFFEAPVIIPVETAPGATVIKLQKCFT